MPPADVIVGHCYRDRDGIAYFLSQKQGDGRRILFRLLRLTSSVAYGRAAVIVTWNLGDWDFAHLMPIPLDALTSEEVKVYLRCIPAEKKINPGLVPDSE